MKMKNPVTAGDGYLRSDSEAGNKILDQMRERKKASGEYDDTDYQYYNDPKMFANRPKMSPDELKLKMKNFMDPSNYPGGCPPWAKCIGGGITKTMQGQDMGFGVTRFGPQQMGASAGVVSQALLNLKGVGSQGLMDQAKAASMQTMTSKFFDGPEVNEDDDLPMGPGFTYMNHLFNFNKGGQKLKDSHKDALTKGMGIITNAMEGVRNALKMIGVAGDQNVEGLPIDMKDVMKIFHGDKADTMDEIERNQFIKEIGDGTSKIDKKKIRKFVNLDGSLTWEILNDDKKTVMSRFTFGEYNGHKIFAQGGYNHFAELLREARRKLGHDARGEFDSIRGAYNR